MSLKLDSNKIVAEWKKLREEEAVLQHKIAFELRMGNKDAINVLLAEIAGVYLKLKKLREPVKVDDPKKGDLEVAL